MGKFNPCIVFTIDGRKPLDTVFEQIDRGFTVTHNLSWSVYCLKDAGKANGALHLLNRGFLSPDPSLAAHLYTAYIRPLLEFWIPACSPILIRDRECIERIQQAATRWPSCFSSLLYETRFNRMHLNPLTVRQKRAELIQFDRIMHGLFHNPSASNIISLNIDVLLCSHPFKLQDTSSIVCTSYLIVALTYGTPFLRM